MSSDHALRPSDEVDQHHLDLAREEGAAYRESLEYMIEEVAETGATAEVEEYLIGFAQEEAEGTYRLRDGRLAWVEPDEEDNCHLEVAVADAADGRFLPYLAVHATLEREDGQTVGPENVPFVWHPGLLHYGTNLSLPGSGTYTVTVEVLPPAFPRHDETNGERYTEPAAVTFEDVRIETGSA